MVFNVSAALTWILFLALFPIAFFWLRRAWRIQVQRDDPEVALKRGESPLEPAKYAFLAMLTNLLAGSVAVVVIGVWRWSGWTTTPGLPWPAARCGASSFSTLPSRATHTCKPGPSASK